MEVPLDGEVGWPQPSGVPSGRTHNNKAVERGRWVLPLLVAALTSVGPFAIDTYLPSFPEMATGLGVPAWQVQQTLSAYLVPFALMNLWHGAIADAVGRRVSILVATAVFAVASVGCAWAPGIEVLCVFRGVQGLASGVGLVVGRAIVRDVYQGAAAQRVLSWVAVLYLAAPAVAPVLGGWLHTWWGWRSVFAFLAGLGLVLFGGVLFGLPETLPVGQRRPFRFGYLARAYAGTLSHPRFLGLALAASFNFAALFLYIASAPVFLLRHLGVQETQFYFLFGPTTAGLALGGALSGRLAGRVSGRRTVGIGYGLMMAGMAANVALHAVRPAGLPGSVLPLFVYATGLALAMPSLTLFGLDLFPERKGLAASCQAFLLTGGNGLTAGLLAPVAQASPLRLAWVSAALLAVGGILAGACFLRRDE